jgi:hypothetical protein
MLWCKRCNREITDAPVKAQCVNCGDEPICEECTDFLYPNEERYGRICLKPCWERLSNCALDADGDQVGEYVINEKTARLVVKMSGDCAATAVLFVM